jgi:hypothetical protein
VSSPIRNLSATSPQSPLGRGGLSKIETELQAQSAPPRFRAPIPWDQWGRAVPKEFLLCSLFTAQKRDRLLMLKETITTNSNVSMVVTGVSLFQYDLDVFLLTVHHGRHGDSIRFSIRDFVGDLHQKPQRRKKKPRKLGMPARAINSVGGKSMLSALESIMRLADFTIDLRVNNREGTFEYEYCGRLIDTATMTIDGVDVPLNDDIANHPGLSDAVVEVTLDPTLAVLFEKGRYTFIAPSARCRLGSSPLALWLYGFVTAVGAPFDLPLSYYKRASGTSSKPGEFKRLMVAARKRLRQEKIVYSSRMVKGRLRFCMERPEKLHARNRPTKIPRQVPLDDAPEF